MQTRDADSSAEPSASSTFAYNANDFWKRIPIGVCAASPANLVLAATKNLCHLLLLQEEPSIVMEKAAHLATQLRETENPNKLLVNQDEVRRFFDAWPDVRLDVSCGVDGGPKFWPENAADEWRNRFAAFFEGLTLKQGLAFGPRFACLLLKVGVTDVGIVAADIQQLMMIPSLSLTGTSHIFDRSDLDVFADAENVRSLLTKYAGAKPSKLLFNTIFGCLVYAHNHAASSSMKQRLLVHMVVRSLNCWRMDLLTLLYTFTTISNLPLTKYRQLIERYVDKPNRLSALESLAAYENLNGDDLRVLDEPPSATHLWMFARVFDERVFADAAYGRHPWLCNFTALLIHQLLKEAECHLSMMSQRWLLNYARNSSMSSEGRLSTADIQVAKAILDQCLDLRPRKKARNA